MEDARTESVRKRRLGDFEVVRELGRGGMGIVYEARQISLNRKVALKVLGTSLGMTSKAVVRFRREAEAAAKLHHTNIVPIYATGEHEGTHFYAMELVEGPSLNFVIRQLKNPGLDGIQATKSNDTGRVGEAEATRTRPGDAPAESPAGETTATAMPAWVAETLCPGSSSSGSTSGKATRSSTLTPGNDYVDTVAKMIASVADGLDYAHNHGVIHRDMKPSNLLLSPDRRLSINDFGLARMLEKPGMTMTGEFVGSPLYMSPEQIAAGRVALDHRTDIYSLGATLYELLTLEPPFPGERRDQIIGQILHKEPRPPRKLNKRIPVDLETICLKAMEKDPDRRYQTAGAMAEDLRRFVNRFAISAKRAGIVGRTAKWVRRHPAMAALTCVIVVVAAMAGALAYRSHQSELRVIQLQLAAAKENALLYAMSGDFEIAEEHIKNAEAAGAAAGWVRLLRAQVAYYRGDFDAANRHVEQALRLMPDSVAALGLRSITAEYTESADKIYAIHEELLRKEAKDFQDFLLKGMAETWLSPRRAIDDLNQAIALRPASPVARVLRADALRLLAMNTGNLHDAENAVEDAAAATGFLPTHTMAMSTYLLAQLAYSNLLLEAGEAPHSDSILQNAATIAEELRQCPDDTKAVWARSRYFARIGDEDRAHATLCDKSEQMEWDKTYISSCCANGWFQRRKYDKALEAFARCIGQAESLYSIPIFLQMETAQDLQAMVDSHVATHPRRENSSGFFEILDWAAFRLVGDADRCNEIVKRWSRYRVPGDFSGQWHAVANYMAGTATASETVTKTEGARFAQSYAHYIIAIDLLARGDRESAKRHFRASLDLNFFDLFSYMWGRTFLERLEDDPTWPPWIPVRGDEDAAETGPHSTSNRGGK